MMLRALSVMLVALLGLHAACAATFRVDDAGTVVLPLLSEARWLTRNGRGVSFDVEAVARVNVRLLVAAWQGKQVRVYMSSPRGSSVPFRASWTTGGLLLSGSTEGASRALVWAGKLAQTTLSDTMIVTLRTDGRRLNSQQSLEFSFEIDVDP